MPSWEIYDSQSISYRDAVLPPNLKARMSIEAGVTLGWEHYVGVEGLSIGVNEYGESAAEDDLYRHFGLDQETILKAAIDLMR